MFYMGSFHSDLRPSGENGLKVKAGAAPDPLPEGTWPVPGGGRGGSPDAGFQSLPSFSGLWGCSRVVGMLQGHGEAPGSQRQVRP